MFESAILHNSGLCESVQLNRKVLIFRVGPGKRTDDVLVVDVFVKSSQQVPEKCVVWKG